MPYKDTKVYFDGSHYIAIPPENFTSGKRKRRKPKPQQTTIQTDGTPPTPTPKEKFETAYKESQALPKRERKKYIKEKLQDEFDDKDKLNEFVTQNTERMKINVIKREIRLWRKIYTQGEWHYFVTFTYSDEKLTEQQFRKKLQNTLKHAVSRNGRKKMAFGNVRPKNSGYIFTEYFIYRK